MLEEVDRNVHGHIEYIVDILAFVAHLEGLLVVAIATTRLTLDIDIGQEVHLDGLHTCTTTLLATTTLHIERETTGLKTSHLGIGSSLEEFTNIAKYIRICCRIRAWRTTNWRLVNHYKFVYMLQTFNRIVRQWLRIRAVEFVRNHRHQRSVYERGFTRAAHTRYADEFSEREFDIHTLKIISSCPYNSEQFAATISQLFRNFYGTPTRKIISGISRCI